MSFHSEQGSKSDSMMQQLVNDQKLPSLMSNHQEQIFTVVPELPQSLSLNPTDGNFVVKLIKSNQDITANLIRGFYFQLFKLCFEMYDSENSKDYLNITKNVLFDRSLIHKNNSEGHYKHLAQFFTMMEEQDASFQEILSKYHEIDQSLMIILEHFIEERSSISQEQSEIQLVLNDLCVMFEITLLPNHPFYHFQESDVYLVVENQTKCYVVYKEDDQEEEGQEEEEEEGEEEVVSQENSESIRSQISVSEDSKSPSQLTQNNMKNDGNFSKQYTFQPQFKGQPEGFLNSNKASEISSSINSKQCNSRPVSSVSYKSHLSSESEYKRQDIPNPYIKIESKVIEESSLSQQKSEMPDNQPAYSLDPFKKGAFKISNPYEISTKKVEMSFPEKFGSYNFSPSPSPLPSPSPTHDIIKEKQGSLTDSHYVNNSISNYYEGYYAELAHNNSMQSVNSKNDTIINIFGDMLKSGKYDGSYSANSEENIGNRPTKKQIQQAEKILQTQQEFQKQDSSDIYPNFSKKSRLDTADMMMGCAKSVNSINEHNSDFNTNSASGSKTNELSNGEKPEVKENYYINQNQYKVYSAIAEEKTFNFVQGPSSSIENKTYSKNTPIVNFDEDDTIFYKPKKSQLKVISEVTASRQSIALPKNNDNFDDSKGSIYRQFSNTRILKLLRQPHKTKVQILRSRFKGQHFNQ